MRVALCISLKFIQFILAVTILIIKKLSDNHSDQVFTRNKKLSLEWTLLNNIYQTREGYDFSIFTFAGYTFVCAVLFLSRVIQRTTMYSIAEKLFLFCGVLFFILEGVLIYASSEYLNIETVDFAFVLGSLAFAEAFLFALDLFCFGDQKKANKATQAFENAETVTISNIDQNLNTVRIQPTAKYQECLCDTSRRSQECNLVPKRTYMRTDL